MTAEPLELYLRALAGGAPASSFLELRHRVADQMLAAEFVPAHDRGRLIESIRRRARRTDVYVGCAPRTRRSGTKSSVDEVWVLWAECDGAEAARAAAAHRPQPPIVIASGSGPNVHAYWPLREPLAAREAEVANLRLAHALGADRVCFDAARILRPPSTWNHKRQPPSPVTALHIDANCSFAPHDVVERTPEIDDTRIQHRWTRQRERDLSGDPLLQLAPAVYVAALLGVNARSGRKVHCPFHADERPSLHVYPTAARGWSCYSCGRGGSIYDLAAAVWLSGQSAGGGAQALRGREFIEVREQLMAMFFGRDVARARGRSRGVGLGD